MKKVLLLSLAFVGYLCGYGEIVDGERPMAVVVASYNNAEWYQKNLDSIFDQKYSNYRVIYVDDCSPDGTGQLVQDYINEKGQQDRVTLIRNQVRKRALENLYDAICSCDDREIVVIVDGDDRLAHNAVLHRLNSMYADPSVWITFGQYISEPGGHIGYSRAIPFSVVEHNRIRSHQPQPSHLRTFYARLFKNIEKEDLLYQGEFFSMTYDLAMMMPMMEMAGWHHKYISEILYIYNDANPISDHRVDKSLQRALDLEIRGRAPYKPLKELF